MKITSVAIIMLLLCSFHINTLTELNTTNIIGTYRLRHEEENKKAPCWRFTIREDLLKLNSDSSYINTRISPQGGFEIIPDTGKWVFTNLKIVLTSNSEYITYKRYFKIADSGIKEQHCKEKRLSNILWIKEQ